MHLFAAGPLFRARSRGADESAVEMDAPEETPNQAAQFIASLTQELARLRVATGSTP
jgi:hypothetical protein